MNNTTKEILTELLPEMAIIVYKNNNKYYLERRDIINGKMASGVPLTEKCLTDIFDVISSEGSDILHGAVPENLLLRMVDVDVKNTSGITNRRNGIYYLVKEPGYLMVRCGFQGLCMWLLQVLYLYLHLKGVNLKTIYLELHFSISMLMGRFVLARRRSISRMS